MVRVLNEPLVLFRDSQGRIGALDAYCPHEGGSLSRARNEEEGLTCPLHGWKFDVTGRRVDPAAIHSGPVRTAAYAGKVCDGLVWIFMGTPGLP